ncbi:MAG: alpha-ketoacid dehydrogenase subunit beta [Candidatus Binatus sp.]|uniref:alpha-ketoacid dehydrogenase subunit beta n=1 Tax=Candidatus Binatus sp. TaxID=2811406 RepID=UPI002716D82C|nr:alpha-ketoacid dehydrogenase subunit beta [Candidatus Binatus sp.]MDO8433541.1 alpha-ketoacid dehydrogenase subunit beta [Candidatus Binatus sp.]
MRTITYAQGIKEALEEEMRRDPTVVLYGEDVANFGGIFRITSGLQEEFGAERVFDTPISENAFVGAAVGAAITGLRPVVELQFADFLFTTADEIVLKAGMWRYVHGGAFKVPMVVRCPSGAAGVGPEHGQCPEAFFMHSPGLRIVSPATPADAKGLLKSAIRDDNPVLYFEHKLLYATKGEIPDDEDYLVPLGKAAIRREGDALTLVAISAMVPKAMKVAERLAQEGHNIEVIDPRSLNPFDRPAIIESVKKTGKIVVAEESYKTLGVGAEIGAMLMEEVLEYLDRPLRRVAMPDVPIPTAAALEKFVIPNEEKIYQACRELLS